MASAKNLFSLAKGDGKSKPQNAKKPVEKKVEKPLTAEEERNLKAKEKVEELLGDVDMTLTKRADEELIEMEGSEERPGDITWLTEQVNALTAENELMRSELTIAKADYRKIFEENQRLRTGAGVNPSNAGLDEKVYTLFNELQANYLRFPPQTMNQTNVNVRYMLNRMLELFPIVNNIKKF